MKRLLGVLGAALLSCSVGAHAATLEAISGEVMVNNGSGYRFVSGVLELKPGDMVIANIGGSAELSYGGGCMVMVAAGSVVTVSEFWPCTTAQVTQPGQAAQPGVPGAAGQGGTQPTAPAFGGITPGAMAIGAIAVGGAIAATSMMGGTDKPASP